MRPAAPSASRPTWPAPCSGECRDHTGHRPPERPQSPHRDALRSGRGRIRPRRRGAAAARAAAGQPDDAAPAAESWTVQTLEAFADTLVPGRRRFAGDLAVAGAVSGPGAVQAGVVDVLTSPALPLAPLLPEIAALLDARAVAYAATHLIWLPVTSPPFVGLSFSRRTDLVSGLFAPDAVDRPIWQILALVTGLAFDTAAHLDTRQALAAGHPGLAWLHFPPRTPTDCGGSRSSRTAGSSPTATPRRHPPGARRERRNDGRTRDRHRVRRRDPRLPPRGGRREGRRPRARPRLAADDFAQTADRHVHPHRRPDPGRRHPVVAGQLRRRFERRLLRGLAARAVVRLRALRRRPAAGCGRPSITRAAPRPLVRPGRADPAGGPQPAGTTCRTPADCSPPPATTPATPATRCRSPSTRPSAPTATGCSPAAVSTPSARCCSTTCPRRRRTAPQIRPLHEVQLLGPSTASGYRYQVAYTVGRPDDYTLHRSAPASSRPRSSCSPPARWALRSSCSAPP